MEAVISDSGHLIATIHHEARVSDFILLPVCAASPPPPSTTVTRASELLKILIILEDLLRRITMNTSNCVACFWGQKDSGQRGIAHVAAAESLTEALV